LDRPVETLEVALGRTATVVARALVSGAVEGTEPVVVRGRGLWRALAGDPSRLRAFVHAAARHGVELELSSAGVAILAPTIDVADLAFQQALGMVEADPVLRAKFHIQGHLKKLTYRPTGAFLRIKSFDPRVVTGSKPAGVLLDKLPNDKQRIIRFFDRVTSRLIELDPALLQDIALDAKLELTSYKSQSQLTQAQMGYNMAMAFLQLPNPVMQKRLRPLVNQFLRALEILNADDITAEYTPEEQQLLALMPPPPDAGGIPTVADPAMNQAA
jgi:hypothetical protein